LYLFKNLPTSGFYPTSERNLLALPSEPPAPVRGRHLEALRAVAANPGGLRHDVYPTVMPVRQELGYVEDRPARGRTGRRAWHLSQRGRDLLAALGIREGVGP
jgi:hypothetical protein